MSDFVTTKPAGLPPVAPRQQLPMRAGSSEAEEVRRGASEGVR